MLVVFALGKAEDAELYLSNYPTKILEHQKVCTSIKLFHMKYGAY